MSGRQDRIKMAVRTEFVNEIPDFLPPGTYKTRVVEAHWEKGDMIIKLEYIGPLPEGEHSLFKIVKGIDSIIESANNLKKELS
jgi:hypothetical protein